MFRLNRIPSGIWPMLTNSRLLQIGMQPSGYFEACFRNAFQKGIIPRRVDISSMIKGYFEDLVYDNVVFAMHFNREEQYPKVDISTLPTWKIWFMKL